MKHIINLGTAKISKYYNFLKLVYLRAMNWMDILLLMASIGVLNGFMYWVFTRFFVSKENGALKFLGLNVLKDFIWVIVGISIMEFSTTGFLILIGVFLLASFVLYFKVIKRLNKL
ncbi:hypothetical protein [Chryseobacterium sp. A321]